MTELPDYTLEHFGIEIGPNMSEGDKMALAERHWTSPDVPLDRSAVGQLWKDYRFWRNISDVRKDIILSRNKAQYAANGEITRLKQELDVASAEIESLRSRPHFYQDEQSRWHVIHPEFGKNELISCRPQGLLGETISAISNPDIESDEYGDVCEKYNKIRKENKKFNEKLAHMKSISSELLKRDSPWVAEMQLAFAESSDWKASRDHSNIWDYGDGPKFHRDVRDHWQEEWRLEKHRREARERWIKNGSKVVDINSLADFGAIDGVITLESDTIYEIKSSIDFTNVQIAGPSKAFTLDTIQKAVSTMDRTLLDPMESKEHERMELAFAAASIPFCGKNMLSKQTSEYLHEQGIERDKIRHFIAARTKHSVDSLAKLTTPELLLMKSQVLSGALTGKMLEAIEELKKVTGTDNAVKRVFPNVKPVECGIDGKIEGSRCDMVMIDDVNKPDPVTIAEWLKKASPAIIDFLAPSVTDKTTPEQAAENRMSFTVSLPVDNTNEVLAIMRNKPPVTGLFADCDLSKQ